MSDESEEPQGAAEDTKPPKIKAEDNPWCLLATLFGVPGKTSDEQLLEMNRIAWNRYFAADVDEETRARLI
ncbi:MAG TPA: hypothetical protein VNY06_04055, partial [Methylocella sp.]|nr:hypothetical protein [Methylocella sp.]